jgi:hypothetical protein
MVRPVLQPSFMTTRQGCPSLSRVSGLASFSLATTPLILKGRFEGYLNVVSLSFRGYSTVVSALREMAVPERVVFC